MKKSSARNSGLSFLIITWQILFTISAIWLTLSPIFLLKIIGEILFGLCILQWFILEHDFGHNSFFRNKHLNNLFGHVASLFSLIPFFPWKNIHHSHHVWTGWKDLDPTQPKKKLNEFSPAMISVINFCWRLWIPIFSVSFSILLFWNFKRLKELYPHTKRSAQHLVSIIFTLLVFLSAIFYFHHFMLYCWLPAFIIFVSIADPMLLSQHTHLDTPESEGIYVRPVKYTLQPAYTRSVVYPTWVSRFILYNFDKHGLHHQYPSIPMYNLNVITPPEENTISWRNWLRIAKKTPAHILIFKSFKETGIKL